MDKCTILNTDRIHWKYTKVQLKPTLKANKSNILLKFDLKLAVFLAISRA